MLDLREESPKLHLLGIEEVLGGVHGHQWNAQLLSTGRDLELVLALHPLRDVSATSLDALFVQMQFQPTLRKIQHPGRLTQQGSQAVPVSRLRHPQIHIPIQALEERSWPAQIEGLSARADLHGSRNHLSEDVVAQRRHRLLL